MNLCAVAHCHLRLTVTSGGDPAGGSGAPLPVSPAGPIPIAGCRALLRATSTFGFLKLTGAVFGNSPRFTRGLSPIAAPFELDRWSGLSERVTMSARSPLCWYERVLRSGKHTHRCSSAPTSRVAGVTGASHVRTLLNFIGRRWVALFDIVDSVCVLSPIGGPLVLRKHARGTSCDPRTPE